MMKLSVKLVKTIFLLLGIILVISSGVLDELSSNNPDSFKFSIGMLFIIIAILRRIRILIKETF